MGHDEIDELIDALTIHVNHAGTEAETREGYPTTMIRGEIEGVELSLNIDSMADANILGYNHFRELKDKVELLETGATIKPYGSPTIPTLGKF